MPERWFLESPAAGRAVVLLLLGVNAYLDIRQGEISLPFTGSVLLAGLLRQIVLSLTGSGGQLPVQTLFLNLTPGLAVLALAGLTGGKIGLGDGIVLLAAGCWVSALSILWPALAALALVPAAAFASAVCRRRRREWPFVPFLCAAWAAIGWRI